MSNAIVNAFLSFVSSANQVQITTSNSFQRYSTVEKLDPLSDDIVLRLVWNDNRCETVFTAEGIAGGRWVDDTYLCKDRYGEAVQLRLLAMAAMRPQPIPAAGFQELLNNLVADGMHTGRSLELPDAFNALNLAIVQGPEAVLRVLFPEQYAALHTLWQLKSGLLTINGDNLAKLNEALNLSAALHAGFGNVVSEDDDPALLLANNEVYDLLYQVVQRSDDLEAESELATRLLALAVNILDERQLDQLLQVFRARLLDPEDDMKDLTNMTVEELMPQITRPTAAPAVQPQ